MSDSSDSCCEPQPYLARDNVGRAAAVDLAEGDDAALGRGHVAADDRLQGRDELRGHYHGIHGALSGHTYRVK